MDVLDQTLVALNEAISAGAPAKKARIHYRALVPCITAQDPTRRATLITRLDQLHNGWPDEYLATFALMCGALLERGVDEPQLSKIVWARCAEQLLSYASSAKLCAPTPEAIELSLLALRTAALYERDLLARIKQDDAIREAIDRIQAHDPYAISLEAILSMTDRTPLLVMDMTHQQAWRGVVDGVTHNFQLHALLKHALASDVRTNLRCAPLPPQELAYYTRYQEAQETPTSESHLGLFHARGILLKGAADDDDGRLKSAIYDEGRPAQIPRVDGVMVILIHRQDYKRYWQSQGAELGYFSASLKLHETLSEQERLRWVARLEALVA